MSPEEIRRVREELACSVGELAAAVGVEVKDVLDWESGERFPTKRFADRLAELRAAGPDAFHAGRADPGLLLSTCGNRGRKNPKNGLTLLADPRLWAVVRKLLAHSELFARVERLADEFPDPSRSE